MWPLLGVLFLILLTAFIMWQSVGLVRDLYREDV